MSANMGLSSPEEFEEELEKLQYMGAFPVVRILMNWDRRKRGLPPLRERDILREAR